jgi:hypothetical protein
MTLHKCYQSYTVFVSPIILVIDEPSLSNILYTRFFP